MFTFDREIDSSTWKYLRKPLGQASKTEDIWSEVMLEVEFLGFIFGLVIFETQFFTGCHYKMKKLQRENEQYMKEGSFKVILIHLLIKIYRSLFRDVFRTLQNIETEFIADVIDNFHC